jgi:hypothetical protein
MKFCGVTACGEILLKMQRNITCVGKETGGGGGGIQSAKDRFVLHVAALFLQSYARSNIVWLGVDKCRYRVSKEK